MSDKMEKNHTSSMKVDAEVGGQNFQHKKSTAKKDCPNSLLKKQKKKEDQTSLVKISPVSNVDMVHMKIESVDEDKNLNSLYKISDSFAQTGVKLLTNVSETINHNVDDISSVQHEVGSVHVKLEPTAIEDVSTCRVNNDHNGDNQSATKKSLESLQDVEKFLVKCEPLQDFEDADGMIAVEVDGELPPSTSFRVKKEQTPKKTSKTTKKCSMLMKQTHSLKYVCAVCSKNFIRRIDLIEHLRIHDLTANFPDTTRDSKHLKNECQICGKELLKKRLREHMRTHSNEKPFQCVMCEKFFKFKHSLTAHSKICAGKKIVKKEVIKKEWVCTICGITLLTKHQLTTHRKIHKDQILKCDRCKKTFIGSDLFSQHIRIYHMGEKPFKCTECDSAFKSSNHLLRHMGRHRKVEKQFDCNVCLKKFSTYSSLSIHITMIHVKPEQADRPFQCALCPKGFLLRSGLTVHMRSHTGEKPYKCSLCNKRYSTSSSLKVHFAIHTGERPFECDMCGNKFSLKRNLKIHILRHAGKKMYKCLMCFKKCDCGSTLKRHIMGHTGERPYECIICTRTYVTSTQLKIHMRKHTSEKPFKCTQCGKSFRVRVHLDRHIKAHTGEKLFECSICEKKFTDKAGVRNHLIVHSGVKPFECNFCKKKFYTRTALRRHSTRTTGECGRIKRRLGRV